MRRAGLFLFVVLGVVGVWQALTHPETPLPRAWNPTKPLRVADDVSPLTIWKLRQALASRELCRDILAAAADMQPMSDHIESEQCHIKNRVKLSRVGAVQLRPVETTCNTALRLALWEAHGIQAAAKRHLNESISKVAHFSSYNCRAMRTGTGGPSRMSTHATASSIDIAGFVSKSGKVIDLKRDWGKDTAEAAFLLEVNEAACNWFRVALGPRYNSLHADHFHLQGPGWGLCR
ncbi:extensin family protein [Lentibacter algarum]|uniref:extensin-like domain-containing protein n=1 Tax=Lentibacter algarum TaxID=576131 RepID=UPI001C06730F|nr:extensin family protein [Lentibacter algarum]MBU2980369.1 extensin family protein [Lentibacter algarum]